MSTPISFAWQADGPVVISGAWLLCDARDDEDATSTRRRWSVGFEAWHIGYVRNDPQYAVTATVAEKLGRWSKIHQAEQYRRTRTWADSDTAALAIVDAQLAYSFDGHDLACRVRNQHTGAWIVHHGLILSTTAGHLHHVAELDWTQVPPALVDVVHRPAQV